MRRGVAGYLEGEMISTCGCPETAVIHRLGCVMNPTTTPPTWTVPVSVNVMPDPSLVARVEALEAKIAALQAWTGCGEAPVEICPCCGKRKSRACCGYSVGTDEAKP